MGVEASIAHDRFPRQGSWVGRRVLVAFHYDTSHVVPGIIVRDDVEAPWQMIIRIGEEGAVPRFVLSTECQWREDR